MNDIARKAGYFVDIIRNKLEKKIEINCGKEFSSKKEEMNLVITLNNGLIKLTNVDNSNTIKILDITNLLKDTDEWECMCNIANMFVTKIVGGSELFKSLVKVSESK